MQSHLILHVDKKRRVKVTRSIEVDIITSAADTQTTTSQPVSQSTAAGKFSSVWIGN